MTLPLRSSVPVQPMLAIAAPLRRASFEPEPVAAFWRNVGWTPAFLAFLLYMVVIISYRVNIGTAAMGATLIALLFEPGRRRLPVLVAGAAALMGWAAIGYTTTAYPELVNAELVDFGKICLVTFAAVNLLRTHARFRFFILFYLALFALFPVRGSIFNYFLYGESLNGRLFWSFIFGNSNDLAAYLLLALSVTAGVLTVEKVRWIKWPAVAGVAIISLLIILTQSRGGFLGLLAFALLVLGQKHHRLRKLAGLVLVSAVVLLLAPASAWDRIGTLRKVDTGDVMEEDQGSAKQRYEIWRVANTVAVENPVFGVGLGAYAQAHSEYARRDGFDPFARGLRDAHSTYLTLMAETGYIGFFLFGVLVLGTVIPAERIRRRAAKYFPQRTRQLFYMQAGLLGYAVAGIFGTYGAIVFTYLHLAIIYALTEVLRRDLRRVKSWERSLVRGGIPAQQPAPVRLRAS